MGNLLALTNSLKRAVALDAPMEGDALEICGESPATVPNDSPIDDQQYCHHKSISADLVTCVRLAIQNSENDPVTSERR